MSKQILSFLKRLAFLSSATAFMSANTTSSWASHQPKMGDDIKKLKKL
ncbi:cyclic lactone autoinducer peptide [Clostridioides mangenotii]|nr:cyclic lactone autoinducer peptide [Clostridioides mangenotii]MCR1955996.1 cyclic lactone autoinducer peptide [Clostridioides mangenotii]